ncbi:MAG: right-handed parallel beta-helix repeat-containing protein, partial [Bacteroidetes bacterium]|nr:right-handed parallel beta-helix repeat-containing protein [Bacteroidota bacterium]
KYLAISNFVGSPETPVIFSNKSGAVIFNTDHYYAISIGNCRYFRLTGTGDPNLFYGFTINYVKGGTGLGIGQQSSDYEIDHLYINDVPIAGLYAKTDPDCSFISTREKFTQFNTSIHDCYITNTGNEAMYIGSSKFFGQTVNCSGKDTLLMPSLLNGVRVYNNIIKASGWDGIQVSSASVNCQIYNNLILNDSQDEHYGQMSGILLGGGSKCDCYNNYIADGKGIGIESHGLGGYRIFNNIIVNAGKSFKPLDSLEMKYGIYVTDVSVNPDSSFYILFNDIINPKSDGIRFSSTLSRNNLVASNAIINPGNFEYYEHGNTSFEGKDAYVMIPNASSDLTLQNNYFARTPDSAGFSSTNYSLQPGSPMIDAGSNANRGITFDFYRHPRPYGDGYDIGAHEYNPAYLGIIDNPSHQDTQVDLYPNPAKESISLRFQVKEPSGILLHLYNLHGTQIDQCNWGILGSGNHVKNIHVADLPDGIYLFILRIGQEVYSGRFLKFRGE